MGHAWIKQCAACLLFAQLVADYMILSCACCGNSKWMTYYLKMFSTFPVNYMYLFTYSACMGILFGPALASYEAPSVGLVFVLTAGIMLVLSVYAVVTNADFTGCAPYLLVL